MKVFLLIFPKTNKTVQTILKQHLPLFYNGLLLDKKWTKNAKTRKDIALPYIALWQPDVNEQKEYEGLALFRNDVM